MSSFFVGIVFQTNDYNTVCEHACEMRARMRDACLHFFKSYASNNARNAYLKIRCADTSESLLLGFIYISPKKSLSG